MLISRQIQLLRISLKTGLKMYESVVQVRDRKSLTKRPVFIGDL